ncbi:hypothetical protein HD593_011102 [Nonomuraea rubra]|uniref:Uncharacterized protein n=1 Tax=Nonomuraea rubra TaxID=46180 RepID=A0A7X0U5R8_9ACTN|nr:hypothetical protein [Nonomuraea rubra]
MLVDIRWVLLLLAVAGVVLLTRKREGWVAPITVGVAVAGLLVIIFKL